MTEKEILDRDIIRVFISQPMGFKSHKEIMQERVEAIEMARTRITGMESEKYGPKIEVLDTVFSSSGHPPLYYLGRSIQLMGQADVVVFAKGWMEARGCRVERRVAREYRLKVLDLDAEG